MPVSPELLNATNLNSALNQVLASALDFGQKSVEKLLLTPKQSAGGSGHGMETGFLCARRLVSASRRLIKEGAGKTGALFRPSAKEVLSAQ